MGSLETKACVADLELIPEPQRRNPVDAVAIHVCAVCATEVFDIPRSAPKRQKAMLTRHEIVFDDVGSIHARPIRASEIGQHQGTPTSMKAGVMPRNTRVLEDQGVVAGTPDREGTSIDGQLPG